jgi:hypothetical protein
MSDREERVAPSSPADAKEERGGRSRRSATCGMALAAALAVIATGLRLADGASYWQSLSSAGMALWWAAMAVFLSRR